MASRGGGRGKRNSEIYTLFSAPRLNSHSYSCDKFMKLNSGTKSALDELFRIRKELNCRSLITSCSSANRLRNFADKKTTP